MARYICNPIEVDAFKIKHVSPDDVDGNIYISLDGEAGSQKIPASMTSRMNPVIGDYLVRTHDGYEYLNPAHVFEAKYTKVSDEA